MRNVGFGSWLCENAKALDGDRRNCSPQTVLALKLASALNFKNDLKDVIPQRFGTQIDLRPEGPQVHKLEDASQVDAWRKEAGLPAIAVVLARAKADPLPTPLEHEARRAAALLWRQKVGWVT
ncbi:hypothetical protein [Bradyrhizobium sp. Leo121]|uniref:hypothetical protein n=1 Tax=Bradyrhizobium sp. Leo121 TaxID=1571195 RepID=UPI0010297991|nr:hypothetical protein [Bradyrhizobium sp. Leo121]RZN33918.1 hypothetical protein CWO90_08800 [Bradyrhizobium sp. Leo121]